MLLDLESNYDEDLQLVLTSFSDVIKKYKNEMNNSNKEKKTDYYLPLFNEIKNLGFFEYMKNTSITNSLLIHEFIGENLLPIIISTSALLNSENPATIGVNYFPDADKAEIIVTPKGVINREEAKLVEVESPDPSVRMFKLNNKEDVKLSNEYDFEKIRLLASAQVIGSGFACMKSAIEYSNSRIAFGKPIGSYEAIKHKIVDDVIGLELARSRYLVGDSDSSKIFQHAFKKSYRAILDSIQIHGGMGFTADLDLHLHLKRILILQKTLF
ncbi:acyl-CoA dehydrogenase [Acidianus sulfidivorans JP7]|uniref:Acyl-CoA dehydrogenase n=1 Tax=Acidianus sulfidivorans JP7 TaxID=619593 RepID=A0A2U9IPX8_9CREN|nr:acyl-CoA dehydrogenase family protein [Acidianus sulfidivorans]AWR98062.1 acyl-CoA dehydrogenase [Acidianus sulfidivorans JP7]